jgi:antitoxin (DNA-binding transcriptional repressor) of toxin-antitoxin stability system
MVQPITLKEAQAHLLDLIESALQGTTVLIAKDNQQIVQLVPVAQPMRRQFGSAKGLIAIADDFDAPLADFEEYTDETAA